MNRGSNSKGHTAGTRVYARCRRSSLGADRMAGIAENEQMTPTARAAVWALGQVAMLGAKLAQLGDTISGVVGRGDIHVQCLNVGTIGDHGPVGTRILARP